MQMVFHLGVHATDGDRMLKTLLNNRAPLLEQGTEVITPTRYRGIFEEALMALNGGVATPEMEQIMLDAVLEHDGTQRVVLSNAGFLGAPGRVVGHGKLYPQIASRAAALANLFPDADCEFFLAIRNPATLLTEVRPLVAGGNYDALMQGTDPRALRWNDAIRRLLGALRGRRVVIWCHEDVPLIWPEVVRLAADMAPDLPLAGALIYMHELLGDAGLPKLRAALAGRDQLTIAARRGIYAEMLERHALAGALDQVVDLPGWDQALVDEVSARYRADIAEIAALPGVEFVTA
ncbi:hypothetical protein C9E82_20805 [Paracoccus siganidrum]|uniref:Sulfotransferase family protein n=2 Tax=Paracoccus siganidrum TaxID=1276757 RepID=A0A419A591_9RHOB|nr:hypothetical protein D3P05_13565 [Paracoccus siganidrum]RMC28946.1 hypothetical protein C9E82_20805 [Paracoccus siganidrum]